MTNALLPARAEQNLHSALALSDLEHHIRTLIAVEPVPDAPLISCYMSFTAASALSPHSGHSVFEERVALLRRSGRGAQQEALEEALERIYDYTRHEIQPDTLGAAIFARGGAAPFFLPLQFQVSLPDWIVAGAIPNIYHLVELKDTYHRFVLLLMTEASARVLEINLGAVTAEVWAQRPELRDRVSSGWTKTHYQHHRKEQTGRFIANEIKVLDRLLAAGGHTHLILAGNPEMTARMRAALPPHLSAKLVDTVHASRRDSMRDIVAATNSLFAEHEQAESLARVRLLEREIKIDGLAAAGTRASLQALRRGQADVLILAKAYAPGARWLCDHCGAIMAAPVQPSACADCRGSSLRETSLREELIRLAEQNGAEIELVSHSDFLMELGGVGCLLRYR